MGPAPLTWTFDAEAAVLHIQVHTPGWDKLEGGSQQGEEGLVDSCLEGEAGRDRRLGVGMGMHLGAVEGDMHIRLRRWLE
mmetsp:Transcript_19428/g.54311  ORF Transcript_19428/g.54311 Transcript_19428/m.54311 type:complete len:80 (+) Transcript_19428:1695-1934(+)